MNRFGELMYNNVTKVNNILLYTCNLLEGQILSVFTSVFDVRIIVSLYRWKDKDWSKLNGVSKTIQLKKVSQYCHSVLSYHTVFAFSLTSNILI